jgi:hypothetical protein
MNDGAPLDFVVEVCAAVSRGWSALDAATRLGRVRSDEFGRIAVEPAGGGWSKLEVVRWQRGEAIGHVDLIPLEKLAVSDLVARLGAQEACVPRHPFDLARIRFRITFPDGKRPTKVIATLSREDPEKVEELMMIPD